LRGRLGERILCAGKNQTGSNTSPPRLCIFQAVEHVRDSESDHPLADLYVVGIGASAGGLEALERFFANMPKGCEMAFVVVQHLSPDFKSLMHELLGRRTELPIHPVENGMLVEPGHIYLIPAKKEMIISGGRLLLSDKELDHQELSLPIDTFFRSLAEDRGPHAIAVVLSGGGSDGSRGVRDIHAAGGLVVVQDEKSAKFDGMPRSARDTGLADWVLAPESMPRVLVDYVRSGGVSAQAEPAPADAPEQRGIGAIYQLLEAEFGLDFSHYKPNTVTRRLERRVKLARVGDLDRYAERLRQSHEELDALYRDLLIGVTRFFRDPEAFELLERRVLPELLRKSSPDDEFRVWVAGCATGEEPYSIAILLHELVSRMGERRLKIFATDAHRGSLEVAARALYDDESVTNVTPERLERYFIKRGRSYQVVPELRQMIVFAPHNVIKDAPFTRVDLISCRNLLIYLQPPAQRKALSLFHFALKRGGTLLLGPSENPGTLTDDFETIDAHWRLYRKYRDLRLPPDARPTTPPAPRGRLAPPEVAAARAPITQVMATYDALLEDFMPPSLLVNDQRELVHAFTGASRFLKPRDGRPSSDVLDMVEPDLKMVLTGGLQRALKERSTVVYKGMRLDADGEAGVYDVSVRPVRSRRAGVAHLLVTFSPLDDQPKPAPARQTEIDLGQVSREQLSALEAELRYTKENLQATIEEFETSNEELQATNEELLASNEELQSTNEELQSVNEELYTVNAEYQRKIAQLTELTNDMDNLLSSTDVGTIFLDRELKVRKFTPRVAESFSLLAHDVGRPIDSFTHNIDHPGLSEDLKSVLASGQPVEREVRDRRGSWLFMRVLPYRAKGAIEGVVLTLIDIKALKAAEDALFHERYLLNSLLSSTPDAIYFKDAQGKFIRLNQPMSARLGLSDPAQAVGKSVFELLDRESALAHQQEDETVLRTGEAQSYKLEQRPMPDGSTRWNVVTRMPLADRGGRLVGTIGVFRDVTQQKLAEEKIHEAVRRRDQFLAMLSHELRNPLGAITNAAQLLERVNGDAQRQRKGLEIINRQSRQMARLLDDLLEVSRVTQNKIELRKRVLDLRDVTAEAADAVRDLMDARGILFDVELDPRPLPVEGDAARLQQIQVNLLSNSAKYTRRGGHVWLSVKREQNEAVLRVRDNGAGVRAEMLDSIFDLFVQSSSTLDRADGGMGVGLTLVRSLVQMHGGSVSAHSEGEGHGTELVVRLPLTSAPASSDTRARARVHWPAGTKIVVVEDNPDSRQTLCTLLELAGFECHSAEDGADGISVMERVRPEIGIIDIGLPGIDGFELARRIRGRPELGGLYLVALTGYGQPTDRAMALEAGFDEHLVKPLHPEDLTRLLSRTDPGLESASDGGERGP
jgi:two-component system, chemotaxis family, CheB/CheR fusion protein